MADWLVEAGVGETRAALIEDGRILEARIVPEGDLIAGTVIEARLVARIPERNQGVIAWGSEEALVTPLPAGLTQGALGLFEITRPATPEPGKPKRARARPARGDAPPSAADPLADLPDHRRLGPTGPDLLEDAGWSELLDEATSGYVAFPGGSLSIALTPAMTVIDIDGTLPGPALAVAGAMAASRAIRRLDIAGSIGIDLPGGGDKAARIAAAQAIDAALPQPFERTAVNGFGFIQIVRPRRRRSIAELAAIDPSAFHARALLRRAQRTSGAGERTITAHPAVIAAIRSDWRQAAERALGVAIALRADPTLAISAGHVQARFA